MDTEKAATVIAAALKLIRTCEEIDYYAYHDAPSRPIHSQLAEEELRRALVQYDPAYAELISEHLWI